MHRIVSCENYQNRNAGIEYNLSLKDALKNLKNDNFYHSITSDNTNDDYILYFDIDGNDDHKIDINDFISKMCSYINEKYYFNLKIIDFCYTKNNKHKYKFHVTVPSICASIEEQKKLCLDFANQHELYKKYKDQSGKYHEIYDSSVYCKNRLFRLPNQSKGIDKDESGIHIIKKGKMKDFILDNTGTVNLMDNIPDEEIDEVDKQVDKETEQKEEIEDEMEDEDNVEIDIEDELEDDIISLLEIFPYEKFYTGRRSWIYFLGLIKSSGCDWHLACKYSKKMSNHEPCTCEKTFNSLKKVYDQPLQKIKNIITKYSDFEYKKESCFDFKNKYEILDFKKEFNNTKYENVKEIRNALTKKMMSVCAFIIDLDCFVIKSNGNLKTIKRVKNCLPKILLKGTDDRYVEYNLQKSIIENVLLNYNSLDYILNDYKNEHIFNIWKGYDAIMIDDINNEVIEVVLDLLLNVFCNGDKELLKYVLTWFSNIVSTGEMNKVALILISDVQGTGKGTFLEFMAKILGSHCYKAISGIGQVIQKHNTILEGRRLLVMNEAASTREEFRSNFDKLKAIITDPTIEIEPKGLSSYEAKNIGNYIIVSNHRDSVVIENNDRRYQVLECSDIYANNTEYFGRVRKVLQLGDDYKDKMDAANSFYTYLMNYTDKVDLFKIIDTPLRQEMKERSLPNSAKFVKEYQERIDSMDTTYEHLCNIRAADLYQKYKEWANTNNEKVVTNTKFGIDIKPYVNKIVKKDATYYKFDKTIN